MSLRTLIWIGAVMTAGCGGQVQEPGAAGGIADPTLFSIRAGCPDPSSCTSTNGTGVYYEEGGYAGIDTFNLLITHFSNKAQGVTFTGRYNASPGWWVPMAQAGNVDYAIYNGTYYPVWAINEGGTYPTITLYNSAGGNTFQVYGYYLNNLTLYISIAVPSKHHYALTFSPWFYEARKSNVGAGQSYVFSWDMSWRDVDLAGTTPQPYCQRAPVKGDNGYTTADDHVVFQQGIDVNPVTGAVTTNANDVTMSCRYGAPAVANWWGYNYGQDLWRFGAAIHMKRASYCGDASYHTISGTKFQFEDDLGIATDPVVDQNVEAFWTPTGAACVNVKNPRRNDLGALLFDGTCNGTPLPACNTYSSYPYYDSISQSMAWAHFLATPLLVDGIVSQ